jgi:hypothetical protein
LSARLLPRRQTTEFSGNDQGAPDRRSAKAAKLMNHSAMKKVALITPSFRKDLERCALLCDSIDRHLSCYERHYIIVNDDDLQLFAKFNGLHRVVMPATPLLPRWLKPVPSWLSRKGRRVWWSFRSKPVHGWHIQQILKIAAGLQLPEQRFCLIDSDNVFTRPFDVSAYAGAERTPLYLDRAAIRAESPLHAGWTRNCDRLLGHKEATAFPADDYIGNIIVWDKDALADMTRAIERTTGKSWAQALCNTRAFSEYLLYGHFVRKSAQHLAAHAITTESLANAYWDATPLGATAVAAMLDDMPEPKVALCIQSFSHTPVSTIREAVGLPYFEGTAVTLPSSTAMAREQIDARLDG